MTVEQLEQLQKLAQAMLNEYSNISALMLATAGVDLDAGAKIARNVPAVKAWDVYKLGVSEGYSIESIRVEPAFVSSAKEFLEFLAEKAQQQSLAA